jgi:hypothetical protein
VAADVRADSHTDVGGENPENMNQIDEKTIVEFAKKDGRIVCVDVSYM